MKTQTRSSGIYPCYSKPLKDKLIQNGFKYLPEGKQFHRTTGKPFWNFAWSPELQVVLDEWTAAGLVKKLYKNK